MACFRAVLFTTSHHHDRRRPPTADGECSTPRPRTSTGPPREKVCHPGSPCPPRSHPRSCKSPQTAPSSHTQILGGFYMHPLLIRWVNERIPNKVRESARKSRDGSRATAYSYCTCTIVLVLVLYVAPAAAAAVRCDNNAHAAATMLPQGRGAAGPRCRDHAAACRRDRRRRDRHR